MGTMPRARRTVNARLAETTSGTQFITEDDLELPKLPKGLDGIAEAVMAARVQVGDPRRYRGRLSGERVRQLGCPFGCTDGAGASVLFSWAHVQFACTGQCVQVARRVWQRDVHAAAAYLVDSGCGRFAGTAGVNAAAGADARKKGWMSTQWTAHRGSQSGGGPGTKPRSVLSYNSTARPCPTWHREHTTRGCTCMCCIPVVQLQDPGERAEPRGNAACY